MNIVPPRAVVIYKRDEQYEVWLMGSRWTKSKGGYENTGVYTEFVATFETAYRAKAYVLSLNQEEL